MIYNTIIVDDEEPARNRLKQLLVNFEEINIIGEAKNGKDALKVIDTLVPDLVFLDIKMPGLDGFEVIKNISHTPIIIFCTAYDDFALKAFENNSMDYLVKPVTVRRLQQSINKLKIFKAHVTKNELIDLITNIQSSQQQSLPTNIPIRTGDKIIFLKLSDIIYFEASDKYVNVINRQTKVFVTEISLRTLEEKLPSNFIRIQRSIIVNSNEIKEIKKYFNGRFIFIMEDIKRSRLVSGKSYQPTIKKFFSF